MAAELTTTKLNHESHLLLEQPLLRLPQEVLRKNFKTAQRYLERETKELLPTLKATANASFQGQATETTLDAIDKMIQRMTTLKRKMATLHEEERVLLEASRQRLLHLQVLYDMESLADVKYEAWSRVRLDRLLVEYLARHCCGQSAKALAKDKNIEALVDLDVFARCEKVVKSLKDGHLDECLAWCAEHRVIMKKIDNRLEFELRLQQYIELCRQKKLIEAREHGRKFFPQYKDTQNAAILAAATLLAFPPEGQHRYSSWYSQDRWTELAALFTDTHHQLFSLPSRPLLLIALSAGLSALKTPSCHSKHASSTANAGSTTTSVCPICSTELNELARKLPYAHHTKSYVENDPVVLPNGRVYGRDRLLEYSAKLGLEDGVLKDPTTSELWKDSDIRKVYIT